MTKIKLTCQGAAAWAGVEGVLTAGAVGIPVELVFDSAWDGLLKTTVAMTAVKKLPMVLTEGRTEVPWEVLEAGLHLYLGVEGRRADGSTVISTVWADCGLIRPSAAGSVTHKPTPNEMEQLLTRVGQTYTREEIQAMLGSLTVNDQGVTVAIPGPQGEPGVTPRLEIGTVTTLPAGSAATASIGGSPEAPRLNLGIPRGADGAAGEGGTIAIPGPQGEPGRTPQKGVDYYTEGERLELVNSVLAALPRYDGEVT